MNTWLKNIIFSSSDYNLTNGGLLGCILATIVVLALLRLIFIGLRQYGRSYDLESGFVSTIKRLITVGAFLLWVILCLFSLLINPTLGNTLTVRSILIAGLIIVLARALDKIISARLLKSIESQTHREIYRDQYGQKNKSNITRTVHFVLILLASIFILRNFDLDYVLHEINSEVNITISKVLLSFLVLLIARLVLWITINLFLYGWYNRQKIDIGKQYAYNQLIAYVVYFFGILIALQYMGINLTLMWAGTAALLVGIGIALQQVISDFFSGLVILFERSVEVGDFLDFGDYRGTVKKIGLRASIVETLEHKDVIIPNSYLVNERVTNWSSSRLTTRFDVGVGVKYGTDTTLVQKLLLDAASKTEGILDKPTPFVRFVDFGDNSLDFRLFFFSDRIRIIEDTKSTLRFEIDDIFREHHIEIPFPQRDVWIKKHNSQK